MVKSALRLIVALLFCAVPMMETDASTFTVVIDPGHGGKDVGAVGESAKEKNVNLGVALKLGEMIERNLKDVKVVYTRKDDTFISLQERANIANRAKGDLFISIHTNSVDKKSPNRTTVSGSETYTLGLHRSNENLDVAKRENSVIELEDDYSTKYQGFDPNSTESYIIFELNQSKHLDQSVNFASLIQQNFRSAGQVDKGVRQAGFWVLAKTSMPAVLVELDFICNPEREDYIASESGQTTLANAIFQAFSQYKKDHDYYKKPGTQTSASTKKDKKKKTTSKEIATDSDAVEYRIQFMSSPKRLPVTSRKLKDLGSVEFYYEDGTYKYTTCKTTDKREAQKQLVEVQKTYKDAFIVEFKNGKRIK